MEQQQRAKDTSYEALHDKLLLAETQDLFADSFLKRHLTRGGGAGGGSDSEQSAGEDLAGGEAAAGEDDEGFDKLLLDLTGAPLAALLTAKGPNPLGGEADAYEDQGVGQEPSWAATPNLEAMDEAEDEAFIMRQLRALEGVVVSGSRSGGPQVSGGAPMRREDIEVALKLNRQLQARLTALLGQVSTDLETNYQLQVDLTLWKQHQQQHNIPDAEPHEQEQDGDADCGPPPYSMYRSSVFWTDVHRMPEPNADIHALQEVLPLVSVPHTVWKWGQKQRDALKQAVLTEVQNSAAEDILKGGCSTVSSLLQQLYSAQGITLRTVGVADVVCAFTADQWARVLDLAAIDSHSPEEVKVLVTQELLPEATGKPKKGPWSLKEAQQLKEAVHKYGRHQWETVAAELGRSPLDCLRLWLQKLAPDANKPQRFTEEEDVRLAAAVEKHGTVWKLVGAEVGRAPWACMHRWRENVALQERKKGKWSAEEDALLLQAMQRCGNKNWVVIAEMVPSRTGPQCRERWHNVLNPDIRVDDWTQEEVNQLVALVQAHQAAYGRVSWSRIMDEMPGRRDHDLKRTYLRLCKIADDMEGMAEPGCQIPLAVVEELNRRRHPGAWGHAARINLLPNKKASRGPARRWKKLLAVAKKAVQNRQSENEIEPVRKKRARKRAPTGTVSGVAVGETQDERITVLEGPHEDGLTQVETETDAELVRKKKQRRRRQLVGTAGEGSAEIANAERQRKGVEDSGGMERRVQERTQRRRAAMAVQGRANPEQRAAALALEGDGGVGAEQALGAEQSALEFADDRHGEHVDVGQDGFVTLLAHVDGRKAARRSSGRGARRRRGQSKQRHGGGRRQPRARQSELVPASSLNPEAPHERTAPRPAGGAPECCPAQDTLQERQTVLSPQPTAGPARTLSAEPPCPTPPSVQERGIPVLQSQAGGTGQFHMQGTESGHFQMHVGESVDVQMQHAQYDQPKKPRARRQRKPVRVKLEDDGAVAPLPGSERDVYMWSTRRQRRARQKPTQPPSVHLRAFYELLGVEPRKLQPKKVLPFSKQDEAQQDASNAASTLATSRGHSSGTGNRRKPGQARQLASPSKSQQHASLKISTGYQSVQSALEGSQRTPVSDFEWAEKMLMAAVCPENLQHKKRRT